MAALFIKVQIFVKKKSSCFFIMQTNVVSTVKYPLINYKGNISAKQCSEIVLKRGSALKLAGIN